MEPPATRPASRETFHTHTRILPRYDPFRRPRAPPTLRHERSGIMGQPVRPDLGRGVQALLALVAPVPALTDRSASSGLVGDRA